jgi:hypothetical protein
MEAGVIKGRAMLAESLKKIEATGPSKTDHIVISGTRRGRPTLGFACMNCGQEYIFEGAQSMPIDVFAGASKGFTKTHRKCKPSEAGRARFIYTNTWEWFNSWDCGTSSCVIYCVFNNTYPDKLGIPSDSSDLGRCIRLLDVAPNEWRESMHRVADKYPEWRPLVDNWAELEALYREEAPNHTGPTPKTNTRLKELGC